jgi:fibronectin type 3 domain-containing protein
MKVFFTLTIVMLFGFAAKAQLVTRTNINPAVTLAWDASPSTNVAGYKMYQGYAGRTYTNVTTLSTNLVYTATNVLRGATYFWTVTAFDLQGLESDYSNEVTNTVKTQPVAPGLHQPTSQ